MLGVLQVRHHDAQKLSLVVDVHRDPPHVFDEFGEPVRNPSIYVPFSSGMISLRGLREVVQRRRQVSSARPHAAGGGELVRRREGRRFQLKLRPPRHFLAGEHQGSVLGGVVDRRQHGARQVRGGNATWSPTPQAGYAVGVQRDDGFTSFDLRGDVRAGAASHYDGVAPSLLVRETEPVLRPGTVDVRQSFAGDLEGAGGPDGGMSPITQLQLVPEERHRCLRRLTEFVFSFFRYEKLGGERHRLGNTIAGAPEEAPHVAPAGVP